MSSLRNLWKDLVDKRLWPVAAVLVVALVAIPVVLSSGSSGSSPGPIVSSAQGTTTPAPTAGSVVKLERGAQGALHTGHVKDPFKQQHVPRPSTGTAPPSLLGPAQTPGVGSVTTGTGGVTVPQVPSTEPAVVPTVNVELRFGRTGATRAKRTLVPRTALPSLTNPLLIFLGVLKDGKTASFLVSSDASPQGDGSCSPTRRTCVTVHMQIGDIEFFDVGTGSSAVQYRLDLLRIFKG